ncbi:uncharacterized protein EV422DRAFT_355974 [Fimicolochytrium jonesii]|uniref:uncharacterized protein n=1 Tax=Fimicolochytrium jonesii TaxID=1396493 RepID=UPI0022FEDFCD|nr:uncharacterized protein EV422DRAFT_355974 [Fimicolochytrium jonesii]KAI8823455.1 hypothetical protein EV422DRAFT_355974 [Fimicolochytrium jonesii]
MIDWEFAQSMLFWAFVPSMATKFIQKQYYAYVRKSRRPPTPAEAKRHYSIIYVVFVVGYLLYTFITVERALPLTHYDYLGVGRNSDARTIKSQYRQLTLLFHPDKISSLEPQEQEFMEGRYLLMRQAYDVLKDPVKRTAYDKFGTNMDTCPRCVTERDYVLNALPGVVTFYVGTGVVMLLMGMFGGLGGGRYWRFVGVLAMGCFESRILLSPSTSVPNTILRTLIPWRTTHEHIEMLRQLFVVSTIAMAQLGPILFPSEDDGRTLTQLVSELDSMTQLQLKESARNFRAAFEPFAKDPVAVTALQRKMEKLAVDTQLLEVDQEIGLATTKAAVKLSKRRT